MRTGRSHRADAITNSPFVRALIRPVASIIPAAATPQSPPKPQHLIPTQPTPVLQPEADTKKRKRELEDEGEEEQDALEVVVSYSEDNLPPELNKYWAQRYRLFSLFDEGCQMDLEGWYSVTPELIAVQIAERCRSSVIVDAFCGVGGNAIQFAFTCEKVIALDISPVRLACAKRNAEIYGVADRITFILGDWVTWSKDYVKRKAAGQVAAEDEVEVVFLSPPWGGIDYQTLGTAPVESTATPQSKKLKTISHPAVPSTPTPAPPPPSTASNAPPSYPLSALAPLPGDQLFALARAMTPHVAYYLPRNVDIEEVARLPESCPRRTAGGEVMEGVERVEIEEEWMGWKMKAVTAYYGDLAVGATEAT